MPLVSICTLTYNHGAFIRECLDGFIMQKTDFKFEVLIHDDASTDSTADIIKEFEAKYPDIIKPIYQLENQYSKGVSISRTYNFPRVKGKYIAMCEGDDYWTDPLKLQKQVDFLEKHSEYSACFTNAIIYNEFDKSKKVYIKSLEEGEVSKEHLILKGAGTYPTASLVFRNKFISDIDFNSFQEIPGDDLLIMCLAMLGKVYFIDTETCIYRMWHGGVYTSISNDLNNIIKRREAKILGYRKLIHQSPKYYKKLIKKRISIESYFIILRGNKISRFKYLKYLDKHDLFSVLKIIFTKKVYLKLKKLLFNY